MLLARVVQAIADRAQSLDRDDRGDVPGWVMITLMTVAIATLIWTFASEALVSVLEEALNAITPGGSGG
jgi:hypothetical protein